MTKEMYNYLNRLYAGTAYEMNAEMNAAFRAVFGDSFELHTKTAKADEKKAAPKKTEQPVNIDDLLRNGEKIVNEIFGF